MIKVSHWFSFFEGLVVQCDVTKRCCGNANRRVLKLGGEEEWTDVNCGDYQEGDYESSWSLVEVFGKVSTMKFQERGENPQNSAKLG